jgi:hypothetical protein
LFNPQTAGARRPEDVGNQGAEPRVAESPSLSATLQGFPGRF